LTIYRTIAKNAGIHYSEEPFCIIRVQKLASLRANMIQEIKKKSGEMVFHRYHQNLFLHIKGLALLP